MTEEDRLPLRILVKGASTVVFTSWMSGPRSDFAWPRVIEAELYAAGYPAEVRCTAIPAELTRLAVPSWEAEMLTWSPDVIVLHYGHMECIHLFIPRLLERHANSVKGQPFAVRKAYRKRVLRPIYMTLARLQAALDRKLPPTLLSFKPRRVATNLEKLIGQARTVGSPLVLVGDIPPCGKPYRSWFPGADARIDVMNATLRDMVQRIGQDDVRIFPITEVVAPLLAEGEDATPDGGHLTPPLHQAVGETIADVIVEWARHQPHLDLTERRQRRAAPTRPGPAPTAN